jgi:hypothetical protein
VFTVWRIGVPVSAKGGQDDVRTRVEQVGRGTLRYLWVALDVLDDELHRSAVDPAGAVDQIDVVSCRVGARLVGERTDFGEIGRVSDDQRVTRRCRLAGVEVGGERRVDIELSPGRRRIGCAVRRFAGFLGAATCGGKQREHRNGRDDDRPRCPRFDS